MDNHHAALLTLALIALSLLLGTGVIAVNVRRDYCQDDMRRRRP